MRRKRTPAESKAWYDRRKREAEEGARGPAAVDPPRRLDGEIDVPAICRLWDDDYNQGLPLPRR